jgi:hypothetical protein
MGSENVSDQSMRQPEIVGGLVSSLTRVVVAEVAAVRLVVVAGAVVVVVPRLPVAGGEEAVEEPVPRLGDALSIPLNTDGAGGAIAEIEPQPVIAAIRGMPRHASTRADREPRLDAMITSPVWIPAPTVQFAASRDPMGKGSQQADRGGHGA